MLVNIHFHKRMWHFNVNHNGKQYVGEAQTLRQAFDKIDDIVVCHYDVSTVNQTIRLEGK